MLGSPAAYVGMLGPGARTERLLMELARGRRRDRRTRTGERIHGPAGLDLGGEGPEEIAQAIVAEIVAVKRRRSGGFLRDRPGPIHDRPRPGTEARPGDAAAELDPSAERVAVVRVAAAVAGQEPLLALRGRAVRPRLAVDLPLRLSLDAVVADGRGRVERLGRSRPRRATARNPVSTAFAAQTPAKQSAWSSDPDGGALRTLPVATDPVERAEQVLHVVPVLVREDVGLRERTALRPELGLQVLEEPEVDVDLVVRGAVEGTRRPRSPSRNRCPWMPEKNTVTDGRYPSTAPAQ